MVVGLLPNSRLVTWPGATLGWLEGISEGGGKQEISSKRLFLAGGSPAVDGNEHYPQRPASGSYSFWSTGNGREQGWITLTRGGEGGRGEKKTPADEREQFTHSAVFFLFHRR